MSVAIDDQPGTDEHPTSASSEDLDNPSAMNDTDGPDNVDGKNLDKNKQASSTDSSDSDSDSSSSSSPEVPRVDVHEWESDWHDQGMADGSHSEAQHSRRKTQKKHRIMNKILCVLAKYKGQWDNVSRVFLVGTHSAAA